jgi:prepilin peptidase CpaA
VTEKLIVGMYAAPLLVAAAWDLATFRIPNTLNLIYLALFPIAALLSPAPVDWLWHLAAFGLVFVLGIAVFAFGLFGGGDVKLLIVAALWLGWHNLLEMAIWVSLAGGAVALLAVLETSPLGQWLLAMTRLPRLVVREEAGDPLADPPRKTQRHIPYGIGICVGGLMMTGKLPL